MDQHTYFYLSSDEMYTYLIPPTRTGLTSSLGYGRHSHATLLWRGLSTSSCLLEVPAAVCAPSLTIPAPTGPLTLKSCSNSTNRCLLSSGIVYASPSPSQLWCSEHLLSFQSPCYTSAVWPMRAVMTGACPQRSLMGRVKNS